MHTELRSTQGRFVLLLLIITGIGLVEVLFTAGLYGYNALTWGVAGVGGLVLLGVGGGLWILGTRLKDMVVWQRVNWAIGIGLGLGVLWMVEIGINNFIAPPLPGRDIIDDVLWGLIALGILAFAIWQAYAGRRIWAGVEAGLWTGFVSGLLACGMALSMIVLGMYFITHDPLNVAEWADRGATSGAPTMAAYFAFETFAGAFLHLIVLGFGMGGLLGVVGGVFGRGARWVRDFGGAKKSAD